MEQKPGWTYSFLPSLNMYMAINDKTGVMYTEDKVMYSPKEVEILSKNNFQLPPSVHLIKKIFNGTLIVSEE